MNNKDLLKALGQIDEEMAADAEISPVDRTAKKGGKWLAGMAVAAACLLLGIFAFSQGLFKREPVPTVTAPMPAPSASTGPASTTPAEPESTAPAESESTAPAEPESTAPAESESTAPAEPASASSEPASSEWKEGEILWQGEGITVKTAAPHAMGDSRSGEPLRAYFTERELFTDHITLRAKVKGIQKVEILNDKVQPPFNRTVASILTLEPVSLLHGDLKKEGPVRIYVDHMVNSSLERVSLGVGREQEGIFMLHETRDYMPYVSAVADYVAGDNVRFAILEKRDGGLSFLDDAYPGLKRSWNLDQAEAYAREVIARDTEAPADFYLSVSWKYFGEEEAHDAAFRYDSRNGYFSYLGDAYYEKEYGAENVSTYFPEDEGLRGLLYNSLIPLKDVEGELRWGSFGRPGMEISLEFCLEGRVRKIHYQGSYYASDGTETPVKRLQQAMTEIRHYIGCSQGRINWGQALSKIGEARRREESKIMEAALMAAFEKDYGPGGAPDFFRGCSIVPGGYLEIALHPATKQHIAIIQQYLKGFDEGFMWADPGE